MWEENKNTSAKLTTEIKVFFAEDTTLLLFHQKVATRMSEMCPGGSAHSAVICTVLIFCIYLQSMEGKAYDYLI